MSDIEVLEHQYSAFARFPNNAPSKEKTTIVRCPGRRSSGKGEAGKGEAGSGADTQASQFESAESKTTYINSFMRETRRDGGTFFFGFAEEEGEFLDCGHRNVSTVVAGQKGLTEMSVATKTYIKRDIQ